MYQDENEKWAITANDMCFDGTHIWFAHISLNLLFRIDIEKEECKTYVIPYEEYYRGIELYNGIIAFEDSIWIIPGLANRIVIFNKKTEGFDYIDMSHEKGWEYEWLFCAAYQYGHFLYCVPGASLNLIRINMKTRALVSIKDFSEYGENRNTYGYFTSKWNSNIIVRNTVTESSLVFIDMKEEELYQLKINAGSLNMKNIELVCIDHFAFMCNWLETDTLLWKVDLNTGNVIKIVEIDACSRRLSKMGEFIVVDYYTTSKYEIYDKEMNLICVDNLICDKSIERMQIDLENGIWKDFENGMGACLHNHGNFLYVYNTTDLKIQKKIKIQVDIIYLEMAKEKIKKETQIWREGDPYTLFELTSKLEEMSSIKNNEKRVGEKIWEMII